jgi:hypothetical protein
MRAWLLVLALAACDAVPEITYTSDADPPDADDAGPVDAGGDAPTTCPDAIPANATSCCNAIPCSGANCTAACGDCELRCTLAQVCCPNSQNHAVCSSSGNCP